MKTRKFRIFLGVIAIALIGLAIHSREPVKFILSALYMAAIMKLFFPKEKVLGQIIERKDKLLYNFRDLKY